jgi:putative zinc finger/helix-turn-helix YgiT family protein
MNSVCPNCGGKTIERKRGTYRFEPPANVPGGTIVVQDAEWEECENCGQQLLSPELTRRLQALSIQRQGLLAPAKIKAIREKLGLTQTAMSEKLGVGEKTYTRWESGRSIQNKSMDNLMRLMDRVPDEFAAIEAQRSPERSMKIADYFDQLGQHKGESQLAMAAHNASLGAESAKKVRDALRKAAKQQKKQKKQDE